jgi:hypothetical protein
MNTRISRAFLIEARATFHGQFDLRHYGTFQMDLGGLSHLKCLPIFVELIWAAVPQRHTAPAI